MHREAAVLHMRPRLVQVIIHGRSRAKYDKFVVLWHGDVTLFVEVDKVDTIHRV